MISFTTLDATDLLRPGERYGAKVRSGFQSMNEQYILGARKEKGTLPFIVGQSMNAKTMYLPGYRITSLSEEIGEKMYFPPMKIEKSISIG
ncbi:MAG: hypothetical protein Q8L82_11410 [Nitrosomonas sp.]|nr:hypothetical protein [Nitrosomonas sp.]